MLHNHRLVLPALNPPTPFLHQTHFGQNGTAYWRPVESLRGQEVSLPLVPEWDTLGKPRGSVQGVHRAEKPPRQQQAEAPTEPPKPVEPPKAAEAPHLKGAEACAITHLGGGMRPHQNGGANTVLEDR